MDAGRCPAVVGLALVLGLQAATAAAGDRVFADGFDPCCSLGGTVTGLSGPLTLYLEAGDLQESRTIEPAGDPLLYAFRHTVPPGRDYRVSIPVQPSGQHCTLANATGTVGSVAIETIDASCIAALRWGDGRWDAAPWN